MKSSSKILVALFLVVLLISLAATSNLRNIEDITPLNSQIDVNGSLDLQSNRIEDLANPDSGDDAMPRSYADNRYLERDGNDYMNGLLDMNNNNIDDVASIDGGGNDIQVNNNLDMKDNTIKNLNLQNVNSVEMDGDIHGGGIDMSLQEVGSILGPNNGDTDLNIQTQGSGSHVVSIEDGSSSNADIIRFKEGTQNVEIPNGNLGVGVSNPNEPVDVSGSIGLTGDIKLSNGAVRVRRGDYMSSTGGADMRLKGWDGVELYAGDTSTSLLRAKDSGNVEIPNGDLKISNNRGVLMDDSGNTAREVMRMNTNDHLIMGDIDGASGDVYIRDDSTTSIVARNGNVEIPNGNLDVKNPSNTGSMVDVGGSLQTDGSLKTFSGDVGSNSRMCIGDRCA